MRNTTVIKEANFAKNGTDFELVALPHTWNAFDGQDGDAYYYRGTGIYKINLPDPDLKKKQFIEFRGANHSAKVYLNDNFIGSHEGGFSTFRFELTKYMKENSNELMVYVNNEVSHIYPQRADFTFCGGIYRDVSFIEAEKAHFDLEKHGSSGVFITPNPSGNTRFDIFTAHSEGLSINVKILDADDNVVSSAWGEALPHTTIYTKLDSPCLWDGVNNPYCYRAVVSLIDDNKIIDEITEFYGYRSFRVCPETGFYLNGKSMPLHGVGLHQDRLDKGWAISDEDRREDADIIKEVGANTIRLAHYQHDQNVYDLCDRYGFVVWAEIPFISEFIKGDKAYNNTISQMTELIIQNYNHPSVCFYGIANEITIGGFTEELYKNLCDLHKLCKTLDPSRLTTIAHIKAVPCDSPHLYITDVQSFNYYFGWYEGKICDIEAEIDNLHAMHPDRCIGISEYGADCLTKWHSLNPINHDYTEEYQAYYHHEMLKIFEKRPYLWATHQWIMFDFAADARDEGGSKGHNNKGLVTRDRKIKKDSYYVYKAYWSKEPVVHIAGRRFANRAPDEGKIVVYTNQDEITLVVNGNMIAKKRASDNCVCFENVELAMGENIINAYSQAASDTITLYGVENHDSGYDLPDIQEALTKGNWFDYDILDENEKIKDGFYSLNDNIGVVLSNDRCLDLTRKWILSNDRISLDNRLLLSSRLTNWKAMWADRTLPQMLEKQMTEKDFKILESQLQKIRK